MRFFVFIDPWNAKIILLRIIFNFRSLRHFMYFLSSLFLRKHVRVIINESDISLARFSVSITISRCRRLPKKHVVDVNINENILRERLCNFYAFVSFTDRMVNKTKFWKLRSYVMFLNRWRGWGGQRILTAILTKKY